MSFSADQPTWPLLTKLLKEEQILAIELAAAQKLCTSEADAALLCATLKSSRLGHLCLDPTFELSPEWQALLSQATPVPPLLREDNRTYLRKNWEVEEEILHHLKRLNRPPHPFPIPSLPDLTEEQTRAVQNALTHPLSLIAGGPGTGKTFTATQIVGAFLATGRTHIALAAPTGKAASNLETRLSQPLHCSTLHSLLTTALAPDLLLIDETSMVDPQLFAKLLSSIHPPAHLVLMGDPNQLPAVEGGSIFSDLLSGPFPITTLTRCLRTSNNTLAEAILSQNPLPLYAITTPLTEELPQTLFHPTLIPPDPLEELQKLQQFALITPLRKGPFGVEALNQRFHQRPGFHTIPLIITQSDSRTGLYNGECGVLIEDTAYFPPNRSFPKKTLPPYEYAYALTVHKTQGSEYDRAMLLLPTGCENFGRELLYTAATRVRQNLTIAAHPGQIEALLSHHSQKISGIKEKLCSRCSA